MVVADTTPLKQCLQREYTSFFTPMETEFYDPSVTFSDPMITISGVDSYKSNVDLLSGRTAFGKFMFRDASIILHRIEDLGPNKLRTRWTLRLTVKVLPWQPTARFTGVSDYTVNAAGKVIRQDDYWDSINLADGQYSPRGVIEGVTDFVNQLKPDGGKSSDLGRELPYTLLRRGGTYDVRRYPRARVVSTVYETRPEGFDRLGSYGSGSNVAGSRVQPLAPSLVVAGETVKTMMWPLSYAMEGETLDDSAIPEPSFDAVTLGTMDYDTVAVITFSEAATKDAVQTYHDRLVNACRSDGLEPYPAASAGGDVIFAQYDAIFSLSERRNEVWLPLTSHDWS